jgi:O-antigen ligase
VPVLAILLGRDHITGRASALPMGMIVGCGVAAGALYFGYYQLPEFAQTVVMIVLALFAMFTLKTAMQSRMLGVMALMVLIAAALYSMLRSPTMSMLVTFPFLFFICRRYFVQTLLITILTMGMFAVAVLIGASLFGDVLIPLLYKSFQSLVNPAAVSTGEWRLYGWKWEIESILSNPFWVFIGKGWGGYFSWYFSLTDDIVRTNPHNQYIVIWSKMGLLGLFLHLGLFLSFYMQAFHFLRQSRDEMHRSIEMILMLLVLGNLVHGIATGFTMPMWIWMGLGTALPRIWLAQERQAPSVHPGGAASERTTTLGIDRLVARPAAARSRGLPT